MSEMSPIARALLGDSDEPEREVPCCVCKAMTKCPGFIWASVHAWNHQENELAAEAGRVPQFIRGSEMVPCDDCAPGLRERKRREYMLECSTTDIYLRDLRHGRYTPDTLRWLREHGHAADVWRVLNEEGNKAA